MSRGPTAGNGSCASGPNALGGKQSVKILPRDLTDTRWRRP